MTPVIVDSTPPQKGVGSLKRGISLKFVYFFRSLYIMIEDEMGGPCITSRGEEERV
jgi:hypothetical protein